MSKKAKGGGASWLATFADLMSLLMALFVLLFAMSSPESAKYKAMVESLTEALGHGAELTPEQLEFFKTVPDQVPTEKPQVVEEKVIDKNEEAMRLLFEQLKKSFEHASSEGEGNIEIAYNPQTNQIQLIFPEQIAFDRGSADLKMKFRVLLRKFYQFRKEPVAIQVVGHTDSIPISGGRFRSNWELSSARASSVITQLVDDGSVRSDQVQAIGLADTHPLDSSGTEEAHSKNRRVEVLITPESYMPNSSAGFVKELPQKDPLENAAQSESQAGSQMPETNGFEFPK